MLASRSIPTDRKTSSEKVFLLVLTFLADGSKIYLTEFSKIQEGSNIFHRGGGQLFPKGPIGYSYRNLYNLLFSRGKGVRTPITPIRIRAWETIPQYSWFVHSN